jgi:hypothetical protein
MKFALTLTLAFIGLALAHSPALAHRPYYSQIERVRLADGEVGEVRLIHGDGIVFTDPVRPLIINSKGQLVARGPKTRSIVLSCNTDHSCFIIDLWSDHVYEPEMSSFRHGPVQPAVQSGDRTDDWDLEDGDESWGFAMREASTRELLRANLILAQQSLFGLAVIVAFAGLGAITLVPYRLNIQSRKARIAARIVMFFAGTMILLLLVAITFWFSMLSGLTVELWLIPTVAGAGIVWTVAGIARRQSHRAVET